MFNNKNKVIVCFQFLVIFVIVTVLLCGVVFKLSLWFFESINVASCFSILTLVVSLVIGGYSFWEIGHR